MSFNATESAFEGFRLARRAPMALLAWAAAYIVFFAVFFAVAVSYTHLTLPTTPYV